MSLEKECWLALLAKYKRNLRKRFFNPYGKRETFGRMRLYDWTIKIGRIP